MVPPVAPDAAVKQAIQPAPAVTAQAAPHTMLSAATPALLKQQLRPP